MEAPEPAVTVIGGGFAGVECAHQLLRRGHRVRLVEMRPVRTTDAHATDRLAEMVCSNSFRSDNPGNAVGLLKREMELVGSIVMEEARRAAVPAGDALAVDRELFARGVTVEFVHESKNCLVHHRETGIHTKSFATALRGALREDPDVILVGEMRDFETISTALTAAETGHLVLSTLHTLDAAETVNRIITVFPPYQQKQVRMQLSSVIKGIISQRLVPRADGKGRVPAVEVMLGTLSVREAVLDDTKTRQIPSIIAAGQAHYGMQTFDQSLFGLFTSGLITYEEALRRSSNPDDFALKIRGVSSTSDLSWDDSPSAAPAAPKEPEFKIDRLGD